MIGTDEMVRQEYIQRPQFKHVGYRHGTSGYHPVMHRIYDIDFISSEHLFDKVMLPELPGVIMPYIIRMCSISDFTVHFHNISLLSDLIKGETAVTVYNHEGQLLSLFYKINYKKFASNIFLSEKQQVTSHMDSEIAYSFA